MIKKTLFILITAALLSACSSDDDVASGGGTTVNTDSLSEEWYAGGKLGTVFNSSSSAYELSTPAVDANAQLSAEFQRGESFFENIFVTGNTGAFLTDLE